MRILTAQEVEDSVTFEDYRESDTISLPQNASVPLQPDNLGIPNFPQPQYSYTFVPNMGYMPVLHVPVPVMVMVDSNHEPLPKQSYTQTDFEVYGEEVDDKPMTPDLPVGFNFVSCSDFLQESIVFLCIIFVFNNFDVAIRMEY